MGSALERWKGSLAPVSVIDIQYAMHVEGLDGLTGEEVRTDADDGDSSGEVRGGNIK